MLHKDYYRSRSAEKKKVSGREPEEAWRQDELIGGKSPVLKWLLTLFGDKVYVYCENHIKGKAIPATSLGGP
jgi:hypothetical protein